MMTWKDVLTFLNSCSDEQLNMPVCGLIDFEPWDASEIKSAPKDDDWRPNQPYLVFPN